MAFPQIDYLRNTPLLGAFCLLGCDVQRLLTKAETHCASPDSDTVHGLYRNADVAYFNKLKDNTMMPSVKDNYRNTNCPINGKLEGVFFCVTLWTDWRSGKRNLPTESPYGEARVVVPLERLFDDSARLYFAEFYYLPRRKNYYVTLVLTRPGTKADGICQKHLIPLDEKNNVFLRKEGSTYKTLKQDKVWVYVFYTDKVDTSGLDIIDNSGEVLIPGSVRPTSGQSNVSESGTEGTVESEARVSELEKELSTLQLGEMNKDQPEK